MVVSLQERQTDTRSENAMTKLFAIIFAISFAILPPVCAAGPEIIGHRGASYYAPENTLMSMKRAWAIGVDGAELDIYLTTDQRIMVIHDETTKRTTGVELTVASSSSEALRALDAGHFKGPEFTGEKIPFLEEVIDAIPPRQYLVVEIKCGPEVLPFLQKMVMSSGKASQIKFIAFDFDTICQAKEMMPLIPAYWLTETEKDATTGQWKPYDHGLVAKVKEKHLDGLDVGWEGLDQSFVEAAHQQQMQVVVWTVDDARVAWNLKKMGVDAITTNRPDFVRQAVNGGRNPFSYGK